MYITESKYKTLVLENLDLKNRLSAFESDDSYTKIKLYYLHRLKREKDEVQKWKNLYYNCLAANKELKKEKAAVNKRWLAERSACADAKRNLTNALKTIEVMQDGSRRDNKKAEALQEEYEKEIRKNRHLTEENADLKRQVNELKGSTAALSEEVKKLLTKEKESSATIGIPTSQTPINQIKRIPNAREKTSRKRGGQTGHKKTSLKAFSEKEATEEIRHDFNDDVRCDKCGGRLELTGNGRVKCQIDYEVKVVKIRHYFCEYKCTDCGHIMRVPVPKELKEENQYGPNIQAMILGLLERGCVSTERTRELISTMTDGRITPSVGFIGKMQSRASQYLKQFTEDLSDRIRKEDMVYWDDTVVFLDTKRACLRFYGNEHIALYKAHRTKGADGLEEDHILAELPKQAVVMHDHNVINYNQKFHFRNIECNEHLLRDLEKDVLNTSNIWAGKLEELIRSTIHKRKQRCKEGELEFDLEEIRDFQAKLDEYLALGIKENMASRAGYYGDTEKTLLERLEKYRGNYFAWLYDFSLPVTNNLSERSLRFSKTHQKVSGQFWKIETAEAFASVQSYIETCRRNGISESDALHRLMAGNPYTVSEIFKTE